MALYCTEMTRRGLLEQRAQPVSGRPQLPLLCGTIAVALTCLVGCSALNDSKMRRSIERARVDALEKIDIEDCQSKGGEVRGVCMFGMPACVIPYPDAGAPCSDSSECEGLCWAEPFTLAQGTPIDGRCTANAQDCKCGVEVTGGRVAGGICED